VRQQPTPPKMEKNHSIRPAYIVAMCTNLTAVYGITALHGLVSREITKLNAINRGRGIACATAF
jgi:hypothetical protein